MTPDPVPRILEDVASALRRPARLAHGDAGDAVSLMAREPGFGLFLAYLWRCTRSAAHLRLARRHLDRAVDAVPLASGRPSFFFGFAGIAWAVEHLSGWLLPTGDQDPNRDVDEMVAMIVDQAELPPCDLQFGLVGYGVYALERLPRPGARRMLERIVERLEELGEHSGDTIAWTLPSPWCMFPHAERFADGYRPLGVQNGAAGVLGFLAAVRRAGIAQRAARRLALGVLAWLWANRLPRGGEATFRAHAAADHGSPWTWAGGDLGIASMMFAASRAFGLEPWQRRSLAIARGLASRPERGSGVRDSALQFGAAGVAHMFRRLHWATRDPLFGDAARRWTGRLLRLRRRGTGVAGFRNFMPSWMRSFLGVPDYPAGWVGLPGFANGSAGVGLALLAATTDAGAAWDRALLLSHR